MASDAYGCCTVLITLAVTDCASQAACPEGSRAPGYGPSRVYQTTPDWPVGMETPITAAGRRMVTYRALPFNTFRPKTHCWACILLESLSRMATPKDRLHELVEALPPSKCAAALQMIESLLVDQSRSDGASAQEQASPFGLFESRFRDAVNSYHQHTPFKDPFVQWFYDSIALPHKSEVALRVLLILIDARFDQLTPAEIALENTKAIYKAGIAMRESVSPREVPALKAPQFKQPEKWRLAFVAAFPKLRALALTIVDRREWTAAELLSEIKQAQIQGMGEKTRRLALRWIHDLIPEVSIDMSSASVPVDRLLYRVAARLGVLDPESQSYTGAGSPADVAVQAFARRISPENPCIIDEPCWMMARQYCRAVSPECERGCIFHRMCSKTFCDRDPVEIGYHPIKQPRVAQEHPADSAPLEGVPRQESAGLIIVSCVKTKIWDSVPSAPRHVPAQRAFDFLCANIRFREARYLFSIPMYCY